MARNLSANCASDSYYRPFALAGTGFAATRDPVGAHPDAGCSPMSGRDIDRTLRLTFQKEFVSTNNLPFAGSGI
jgi:hypothetical protein